MSKPPRPALPDLDDSEFTAKLKPLSDAVIQKPSAGDRRSSGHPDVRRPDSTDEHNSGYPDIRESRLSVAERIEQIEQIRGPKRRFEFLIPVRVGEALASDAAVRGQSAATRLLEVLRDAGYPVIPEDFVDLRKERGRETIAPSNTSGAKHSRRGFNSVAP
jgi:hypothetical protein